MDLTVHTDRTLSSAVTQLACFPFACLDVHHCSLVLLCKMLQQDHVVFLIGIVNKYCLAAHTQDLKTDTQENRLSPECQGACTTQ